MFLPSFSGRLASSMAAHSAAPEDYTLWEILTLAEGDLAPVACLQRNAAPCQRAAECRTLPVWQGYYDLTRDYFSGITLADLMNAPQGGDYVI